MSPFALQLLYGILNLGYKLGKDSPNMCLDEEESVASHAPVTGLYSLCFTYRTCLLLLITYGIFLTLVVIKQTPKYICICGYGL